MVIILNHIVLRVLLYRLKQARCFSFQISEGPGGPGVSLLPTCVRLEVFVRNGPLLPTPVHRYSTEELREP